MKTEPATGNEGTADKSGFIFLFPGQGSHYVRMGLDFYQARPEARAILDALDRVAGHKLAALMFRGPERELTLTENLQPAICAVSAVCLQAVRQAGIRPAAVAGHSLGELTAAYAAGTFDYDELIRLALLRGRACQQAALQHPGGMLAVTGLPDAELDEVIRQASAQGVLVKANLNIPDQTVISGEECALLAAGNLIRERCGSSQRLKVNGPWHSPLMAGAMRLFGEALRGAPFRDAAIDLYSNVTAAPEHSAERIKDNLERQICAPVRWLETIQRMMQDYPEAAFIEIGPGRVLKSFMLHVDPRRQVFNVEDVRSLDFLVNRLKT